MDSITVVIPTSYIPSHPKPYILNQTLQGIRQQLPTAPILVTCDGLPPSQDDHRAAYDSYLTQIEAPTLMFSDHVHQNGMMITALPLITTPLLVYLEHDWDLRGLIEWDVLENIVTFGMANYVKFAPAERIYPLYEHMMHERVVLWDVPLIQTVQYSANPHLAKTDWYRELARLHFSGEPDYIENLLYKPIANAPWREYRCMIYNPVEGGMKRSYHLDGAKSV